LGNTLGLKEYIARRLVYNVVLLFFVVVLNFIIFMAMPGDPTIMFIGRRMTREQIERVREMFGLDEPLHKRFIKYMWNMLTWRFGISFYTSKPVYWEIVERIPNTLLLMGISTALSIAIGTLVGAYAAYKRGSAFDTASVMASLITYSLPTFWMGMIFILIFGKWAAAIFGRPLFPIAGTMSRPPPTEPIARIVDMLWHMVLPVTTIFLFSYGQYVLLMRSAVLENLTEDYIITAKAKGLDDKAILFKHALRNALLPLITQAAISFGFVLSGAIITETVFTWRGLGTYIWQAIQFNDYPRLQATFYIIALCVIIANFIADILYGLVDPRIRYE